MRSIRISEEVWQEVAARGRFGETEDDVLRRIFDLPNNGTHNGRQASSGSEDQRTPSAQSSPRIIRAKKRLRSFVAEGQLHVGFYNGPTQSWPLPARSDKDGIRAVRVQACRFASEQGATQGQISAVRKALTDAGYHLYR
jgi:hypothetical protein